MRNNIHNSCIFVNLYTVSENIRSICASVGEHCGVIPVLKGDAFGLGLLPIARCITETVHVPYIAVAHVSEGIELRRDGIDTPILVLGGILPEQCADIINHHLTPAVTRLGILPCLAQEARAQRTEIDIHIALDTGLGRLGVRTGNELSKLLTEISDFGDAVHIAGTYSHFAAAEMPGNPKNLSQLNLYQDALLQICSAGFAPGIRHLSNSAASEHMPQTNFDAVRVGRRLFFDSPLSPNGTVHEAASWRTRITGLRDVTADEIFGYGSGMALGHAGTVALIGVGYGDGLRHDIVRAHAPVLIRGVRAPLLGMCMDQAFVDVTGIDCEIGDEVTMFGYSSDGDFLSAQEVAAYADDEGCGLSCMLLPRVKRIYE